MLATIGPRTNSLRNRLRSGIAVTAMVALIASSTLPALAQTYPAGAAAAGDPAALGRSWPREIPAGALRVLMYQPQIDRWDGHRLDSKAALSVGSAAGDDRSYGIVYFTGRSDVDKSARQVLLHDVQVTRVDMPGDPALAGPTRNAVQRHWGGQTRTVSLDWLQAALAASQAWKSQQQAVEVDNTPPNILFSTTPAVLVLIDGEPVLRPVIDTRYERIVNSNALILKHSSTGSFHLRVAGLWATAPALQGPWSIQRSGLAEIDRIKAAAVARGNADILDDDDQPGPYGILPAIYISGVPIELLQSDGEPQYAAIEGTRLLYVANTVSDIFVDTRSQDFHVLISGRWFRAGGIDGPWAYVDSAELPEDFRRIAERHPKGDVLASIAGTPQAEEAAIANTIPQTATIDRQAAAPFQPVYDGAPQFQPVTGTPLHYAVNSPMPIVRVEPNRYYVVYNGAWYTGPSPTGPWSVADFVPPAIYAIPPSSPIYYATYVRVYGQDKRYVHVGYTPGYFGTYVTQRGTVVYGSGHRYRPWIAEAYYPRPASYGFGAAFVSGGFAGFALGLATAAIIASPAWGPYWHRDADRARRADAGRTSAGRDEEGRDQQRFSSNVYGQSGDRGVVRSSAPATAGRPQAVAQPSSVGTSAATPAAPPFSMRERDRYRRAEEMRRDSQSYRDAAARNRAGGTPSSSTSGTASQPVADRSDVFVGADGKVYRRGEQGWERNERNRWTPADTRRTSAPAPSRTAVTPVAAPARAAAVPVPAPVPAAAAPAAPVTAPPNADRGRPDRERVDRERVDRERVDRERAGQQRRESAPKPRPAVATPAPAASRAPVPPSPAAVAPAVPTVAPLPVAAPAAPAAAPAASPNADRVRPDREPSDRERTARERTEQQRREAAPAHPRAAVPRAAVPRAPVPPRTTATPVAVPAAVAAPAPASPAPAVQAKPAQDRAAAERAARAAAQRRAPAKAEGAEPTPAQPRPVPAAASATGEETRKRLDRERAARASGADQEKVNRDRPAPDAFVPPDRRNGGARRAPARN